MHKFDDGYSVNNRPLPLFDEEPAAEPAAESVESQQEAAKSTEGRGASRRKTYYDRADDARKPIDESEAHN